MVRQTMIPPRPRVPRCDPPPLGEVTTAPDPGSSRIGIDRDKAVISAKSVVSMMLCFRLDHQVLIRTAQDAIRSCTTGPGLDAAQDRAARIAARPAARQVMRASWLCRTPRTTASPPDRR